MTSTKAMISLFVVVLFIAMVYSQQFPLLTIRRVRVGEATPQIDQLHRPGVKRQVGRICKYADDCISGCCVEDSTTRQRYCKSLATYGQRCDEFQLKGGYYWNYCPCQAGEGYCNGNVCSA